MADEENEEINLSDLEEEIDPDKEVKPEAKAKPAPVPGPGAARAAPSTGLKDLERQVATERSERTRVAQENARLQSERDNAIRFAQEAERRGVSTFELYVDNQINSMTEQMDALTAQQEGAYADGDFKTVAAINRKLADLGGDLASAKRDKATLATQRETMKQQHQQPIRTQPQQPQVPTDPLERAIMNRTEPTKAFLRKHPELVRGDGSLKRTAIDAHDSALDAGHAVDTPGYFQFIEGLIGPGSGNGNGELPARGRAPSMAAPVARGTSPDRASGVINADGTFTITPKMRRLAEEQGVPVKEWVQNYVRLVREGRMTPIT
jgi:hypothetical protein